MSRSCTVLHVVAARPNFMKVAPVLRALDARPGFRTVLVHTGQHYDASMSDAFFSDLGIRTPDLNLGVGSGTHGAQTAGVIAALEPHLLAERPELVLVAGDVNSTLAAALAAAKLCIPVAHLEAGLRSGDRTMPEELNRILTDQLAELCLTLSPDADENLLREGIAPERIHFVGNAMIDSLLRELPGARREGVLAELGLERGRYAVATLRVAPELYAGAFHQYRPDLVVGTRVITMSGPRSHSSLRYLDRHLLMSAARRGVPTMVLVSSWDNLTTSGFFPVELDRMTVWNEIMREQAVAIHGLPADRVVVTGAPQHDLYATHAPFQDRACFFATLGLDPARPLVVYTTATDGTIPGEPELVATIQAALARELPNVQLLVRLH